MRPRPADVRIGQIIRQARLRRRLTQTELATRCGISVRHLKGIEHGSNFTVAVLFAIIEWLPDARAGFVQLLPNP
jgi:transcriptional regulator with XRE-family HTH domain